MIQLSTDAPSILLKIVEDKRAEIENLEKSSSLDELMKRAAKADRTRGLKQALRKPEKVTLIAELKKASPSKGLFREDFVPAEIARAYVKGGAVGLSVLTETIHFQGHPSYLQEVRDAVAQPILRKDFIVSAHQIPESRILGADAILLIAALLSDAQIREFLDLAKELHLDALCEVHDEAEMKRVIDCGADFIGVNNRDLRTFEVDLQTSFDLFPLAPEGAVLVGESGIRCWADIELMRDIGVDAVLVGETLIRQDDITQAARNLYDPNVPTPFLEES
ncbi:MAG: indole-3-glycerol phosphate synthase TrpC [Candidatus Omnitrophica bacterium]|nr:indole-3-glycerol phosphate synthase TrpC [Candidatus Omnitrophota bacterium]